MKILSCHIENFGKIHDYSMEFCDGANMICEENGWGKSTFAAFVRAMFYGLEGDRKRSLEENERKRYRPWQGGVFGGQLVFETQGKEYLISRIFKDKEANDEFELRDAGTNLPSEDYSDKIGEEIFKINRESFLRTVFIGQNQCETSSSDDINAKIGRLAEHSNDLNNYEAASARLTEILNKLNPNRVSGSIAKRSEEIARYDRIVKGGEGISDSIEEYQNYLRGEEASYEALKIQMQEAGEKQKIVSEQQSVLAKKSERERLKRSAARRAEEKAAIRRKFPGEVPALEEVKRKITECGAMEKAHERASTYRIPESEKGEFDSLEGAFRNDMPSDEEIEAKLKEIFRFRELSRECQSEQLHPAERERLEELEPYFADDLESVTSIVGKWNNRNTRKGALPSKQAALMALEASMGSRRQQGPKGGSLLLPLGILLAVAGVLLAVLLSPVADRMAPAAGSIVAAIGIITAVAGAACMFAGVLAGRKGNNTASLELPLEFEELRRAIEEDEAYIAGTDQIVTDYVTAHGKNFNEETVTAVLQEITEESMEYISLKKKYQKSFDSTKTEELEGLRHSLHDFLGRYGIQSADARFGDDLYILRGRVEKYKALLDRNSHFERAEQERRKVGKQIFSFLKKYGYEVPRNITSLRALLDEIRDQADDYQDSADALEEAEKELKQFEAENAVSDLDEMQADESLPTLEELNQEIQQLAEKREEVHNRIGSYNKTLESLWEAYDEWEENCAKRKELRELQSMEQEKYRNVHAAKKKLELAKETMTAKYADPILQGFRGYYEMISGVEAAGFHIDANTSVTVDELGKQRDTNALSSGYRDLIGICLRIALVDAMYQEEEPVLIMDDPFTNLDDKKVSAGRNFLEKLGQKYQIIYFTCSAARQ